MDDLDDLDDRLRPGFCPSCERAAPPRRTFCDECAAWMDAGNAIRRAATALRAVPAPPAARTWQTLKQAEKPVSGAGNAAETAAEIGKPDYVHPGSKTF